MEIERAIVNDYAGILELQSKYYIANLSPDQQKDGFLSAEFTLTQVAAMAEDLGIVVARSEGRVVGYACSSRVDLAPRPAIVDAMLKCIDAVDFHGRRLLDMRVFIYGPVCIDSAHRGKGVLKLMFDRLTTLVADQFDAGVAFIAVDNPRSFAAHTRGLAMEKIGLFQFGGNSYHVVAFTVSRA